MTHIQKKAGAIRKRKAHFARAAESECVRALVVAAEVAARRQKMMRIQWGGI
jgi:hypothetical protein